MLAFVAVMLSERSPDLRELYLELIKRSLTGALTEDCGTILGDPRSARSGPLLSRAAHAIGILAGRFNVEIVRKRPYEPERREIGGDWPAHAESMIGLRRMDNIRHCVEAVVVDHVPGDLIETGVWRGGATIYMRAVLKAFGDTSRTVWVADSFCGLPRPNAAAYTADAGDVHYRMAGLAISIEQVRHNFERYGLLDDHVRFLPGWFRDTLPAAPIDQLAVIRLDGDMYESTIQAIEALYPKLSPGGFCIVDDFGSHVSQAQRAVHDYRAAHAITEEIVDVDGSGAYWRKSA